MKDRTRELIKELREMATPKNNYHSVEKITLMKLKSIVDILEQQQSEITAQGTRISELSDYAEKLEAECSNYGVDISEIFIGDK